MVARATTTATLAVCAEPSSVAPAAPSFFLAPPPAAAIGLDAVVTAVVTAVVLPAGGLGAAGRAGTLDGGAPVVLPRGPRSAGAVVAAALSAPRGVAGRCVLPPEATGGAVAGAVLPGSAAGAVRVLCAGLPVVGAGGNIGDAVLPAAVVPRAGACVGGAGGEWRGLPQWCRVGVAPAVLTVLVGAVVVVVVAVAVAARVLVAWVVSMPAASAQLRTATNWLQGGLNAYAPPCSGAQMRKCRLRAATTLCSALTTSESL